MDLSIIIVSWRVKDLLKNCLASVFKETKGIEFEVFVVDNASRDGTVEMVKEIFPKVNLIVNDKNEGFARANNKALEKAKGDYLLVLNPDTEILDQATSKMVALMREKPEVGISGCQILNPDQTIQPSVRRFPTLISQLLILLKIHHFLPKLPWLVKYFAWDFDYSKEQAIDQVMGAFFMISRPAFAKVGLFDEKFWIWFEEVDYCKRVVKAGWPVLYSPRAQIIHHFEQSFSQVYFYEKQILFNRSLFHYFKKQHNPLAFLTLIIVQPLNLFLILIIQIFKRK